MIEIRLRPESPNKTIMQAYISQNKSSDAAIVIFPGGGYWDKAEHEGKGYAEFLNKFGYNAFVVQYTTKRQCSSYMPEQLLDARAAIRYLRANSSLYGINKKKIYVMGSSAGGHLAALVSTCKEHFEIEQAESYNDEDYLPDGQILCYPVIELYGKNAHVDSAKNLLGDIYNIENCKKYSPNLSAEAETPPAFIWHTFTDSCVPVENSLDYASRLVEIGTEVELHIYPTGEHGLGLANELVYVSDWSRLLLKWLERKDKNHREKDDK